MNANLENTLAICKTFVKTEKLRFLLTPKILQKSYLIIGMYLMLPTSQKYWSVIVF